MIKKKLKTTKNEKHIGSKKAFPSHLTKTGELVGDAGSSRGKPPESFLSKRDRRKRAKKRRERKRVAIIYFL